MLFKKSQNWSLSKSNCLCDITTNALTSLLIHLDYSKFIQLIYFLSPTGVWTRDFPLIKPMHYQLSYPAWISTQITYPYLIGLVTFYFETFSQFISSTGIRSPVPWRRKQTWRKSPQDQGAPQLTYWLNLFDKISNKISNILLVDPK